MVILNNDFEYTFFGWIPTKDEGGKGIGIVDRKQIFVGSYPPLENFTLSPDKLDGLTESFIINDFSTRERSEKDKDSA